MNVEELNELVDNLFRAGTKLSREQFCELIKQHKEVYKQRASKAQEKNRRDEFNKYKGRFYAMVRVCHLLELLEV
jgi:uncharacterized protein YaaR (DUF327 family)